MALPTRTESTMLHSMLEHLLDTLGFDGPQKNYDELLPQLHVQCKKRVESSDAKCLQLSSHLEALNSRTTEVSEEVSSIQVCIRRGTRGSVA
jgi:hypothetical protein